MVDTDMDVDVELVITLFGLGDLCWSSKAPTPGNCSDVALVPREYFRCICEPNIVTILVLYGFYFVLF